jgi:hypothetical protein
LDKNAAGNDQSIRAIFKFLILLADKKNIPEKADTLNDNVSLLRGLEMNISLHRNISVSFLTLIFLILSVNANAADDLYTAVTDDGYKLKMKRYRPDTSSLFRSDGQPVILFPGIFANMNEFDMHTPDERKNDYSDMQLPNPLAKWAQGDKYIDKDPMRYFSLAHCRWLKGYDPWLANYRGTGRGEFKSEKGDNMTTLDLWGVLDSEACITKVIEVTGKTPVIGGHSTGGFASYAYLQGTYFDIDEMKQGYKNGYIPHVKSNPELAAQRNSFIKGFIAIDPGLTPWVPAELNNKAMWKILGKPLYLDLDSLMENIVNPLLKKSNVTISTIDMIFSTITKLNKLYGSEMFLIPYLDFWYMENTYPFAADFYGRYALASTYMRCLSQWGDIGVHHAIREHWKNGIENKDVIAGPVPEPGFDGYYYYDQNMHLVSVPTIAVLSESNALVIANEVVELLMNAKTKNPDDEWHLIPGTAHVDIVCGLNAPDITFPLIGNWLDRICAEAKPENDQLQSGTEEISSEASESSTFCFIKTISY